MAYQALYRKYRPQNFDEVVGQNQIVQTLNNAVHKNRIAHAYLFCGPRGTGKTSIAKIFAKTLNCTGENPPCGECDNCKLAADGTHPDIIEIDAASNNGVDEVRNLIELVNYAPIQGKYKVYIIDEVHMMTTGAFNALLKTIEEPPAHAVFIFATTEPNKVLPTILSRCQRFDFNRVADTEIIKRLLYVCEQEHVPFEQDGLEIISMLADGGMRDSLSILDQCIAYSPDLINAETVRTIYGLATEQDIGQIFQNLNPAHAEEAIQHLISLSDSGMDLKRFLSDFIHILKNSLLMDFSPRTDLVSDRHRKVIQEYFAKSDSSKRIRLLEDLMETMQKISYASNILDYIETVFLKNSYEKLPVIEQPVANPISASSAVQKQISEIPAKKSEISKKTPQVKPNHSLIEKFWKSDVSRETFPTHETAKSTVMLQDEFILSLLAGSDKNHRMSDAEKLKDMSRYTSDLSLAKFVMSLQKAHLEASSETYLLFSVPTNMEANQINEFQNTEGYEALMFSMLGQAKAVYAIASPRVKGLFKLFSQRWKEKTLPPAYTAPLREIHTKEEEKEDTLESIKNFFPELQVVED